MARRRLGTLVRCLVLGITAKWDEIVLILSIMGKFREQLEAELTVARLATSTGSEETALVVDSMEWKNSWIKSVISRLDGDHTSYICPLELSGEKGL